VSLPSSAKAFTKAVIKSRRAVDPLNPMAREVSLHRRFDDYGELVRA